MNSNNNNKVHKANNIHNIHNNNNKDNNNQEIQMLNFFMTLEEEVKILRKKIFKDKDKNILMIIHFYIA